MLLLMLLFVGVIAVVVVTFVVCLVTIGSSAATKLQYEDALGPTPLVDTGFNTIYTQTPSSITTTEMYNYSKPINVAQGVYVGSVLVLGSGDPLSSASSYPFQANSTQASFTVPLFGLSLNVSQGSIGNLNVPGVLSSSSISTTTLSATTISSSSNFISTGTTIMAGRVIVNGQVLNVSAYDTMSADIATLQTKVAQIQTLLGI